LSLSETDDKKTQTRENKKELKSEIKKQRRKIVPDNKRKAITCRTVRAKREKQTTWLKKLQSLDKTWSLQENRQTNRLIDDSNQELVHRENV